ncbi:MAG: M48 family metallopeptidase [Anaerolineae bacterium]|nr:M48 family metallopeptidase [Anaerolineae bacterium]
MGLLVALVLIQFVVTTVLSVLNVSHLGRMAKHPPGEWADQLDFSQFPKMVAYTVAKSRLGHVSRLVELAFTLAVLLSGAISIVSRWASALPVARGWQGLVVLGSFAVLFYLVDVPFDLLSQFGVEKRFGFSTISVKTWLADQLKSLLITAILGLLLGGGLLFLIGWLGQWWWVPAWVLFSLFQVLMMLVVPVLILPLFNKFEPLQDAELGEQIIALAREAHFPLSGVFQIDASRRSTHSNAYFTGIGKARRIALFDTLIEQHTREEILAVMAHEIGHWKLRHVLRMLVSAIVASGASMAVVALLLDIPWLYQVLGNADLYAKMGVVGPVAAAGLFLVGILLSPLGLILSPLTSWFSRRYEYQADAFSLSLYRHATALERGLIRLNEKNLSNLFPHPWVVIFYYSHPPLFDRVAAIRVQVAAQDAAGSTT